LKKEYILVGGYPGKENLHKHHGGGQLTASTLLVEYAEENDICLHVVNTAHTVFPSPTFKEKIVESKKRIGSLLKILNNNDILGVIIFSSTGLSFYEKIIMAWITKRKKIKTLFFIRSGHFIDLNENSKLLSFINKKLLKVPTYLGAQGSKWIEFYKTMGLEEENIKLIPNWIRLKMDTVYHTNDKKVIFLYVGWTVKKKGILEVFNVIENNSDLNAYTFLFAGGGTLLEELKERKINNKLHNVEMLGWVKPKDLPSLYKESDVFILPSHAEGFPNVILEALNYGLPIISTNVGGIADSVIDNYNGFIFEARDKEKLYQSIKRLASSVEQREKFSKNGQKVLKERHEFHRNCQMIFDTFEDVK
jgi:glycosyltransferase involved in cell wall biosynthesis